MAMHTHVVRRCAVCDRTRDGGVGQVKQAPNRFTGALRSRRKWEIRFRSRSELEKEEAGCNSKMKIFDND